MDSGQFIMFGIQTATTLLVGFVGWSLKGTLSNLKDGIRKNTEDVDSVQKELNDLKSDLPLVYTLREDYIRCQQNQEKKMNSIEDKLDKLLQRG